MPPLGLLRHRAARAGRGRTCPNRLTTNSNTGSRRCASGATAAPQHPRAHSWLARDALLGVTTVDAGFELAPTAAYVVGHESLTVVAGGSAAATPRVLAAIEAGGRQPSDVAWIVLPCLSQWWSLPRLLAA